MTKRETAEQFRKRHNAPPDHRTARRELHDADPTNPTEYDRALMWHEYYQARD